MPQPLTSNAEPTNGLYYGEGGMGKTTALAAMANLGRILLVNAESGIKARALRAHGINVDNIEVYPAPGEPLTFDGLHELGLQIREDLHKDPESWAGIGWDSITEIQQAFKDRAVEGSVERANRRGQERGLFVVDQDNWREANEQCRRLIRMYRDLPCHFAMTALARREQDDDGTVTYQPGVTASLQHDLVGWVDFVCVTSVVEVDGEEEFRGLFRPHSKWRGKDRDKVLPKWIVDPWFDRLMQYYDGEIDRDTDPVMIAARERQKRAETEAVAA